MKKFFWIIILCFFSTQAFAAEGGGNFELKEIKGTIYKLNKQTGETSALVTYADSVGFIGISDLTYDFKTENGRAAFEAGMVKLVKQIGSGESA